METTLKESTLKIAIDHHIKNKIPFTENVFKSQSELSNLLFAEAKFLHATGKYDTDNEFECELLESDIGEFGIYRNKAVPLDIPIECVSGANKKFCVYIKDHTTGKVKKLVFNEDLSIKKLFLKFDKTSPWYWSYRLDKFLSLIRSDSPQEFQPM